MNHCTVTDFGRSMCAKWNWTFLCTHNPYMYFIHQIYSRKHIKIRTRTHKSTTFTHVHNQMCLFICLIVKILFYIKNYFWNKFISSKTRIALKHVRCACHRALLNAIEALFCWVFLFIQNKDKWKHRVAAHVCLYVHECEMNHKFFCSFNSLKSASQPVR